MNSKTFKTAFYCCWGVLFICIIIRFFGYGDIFNIVINNQEIASICKWIDQSWVLYAISCILFGITEYLTFIILIHGKIGEKLWFLPATIPFNIIMIISPIVSVYPLILFIFITSTIILIKNHISIKTIIFRHILCFSYVITYWYCFMYIHNINWNDTSIVTAIIWFIDETIMLSIYYLYIRLNHYNKKNTTKDAPQTYQMIITAWAINITAFAIMLFIAEITNKMFEIVITSLCFFILRPTYEKQFHALSISQCCIVSLISISILSWIVLPNWSLLATVIVGLILTILSFVVRDYFDAKLKTKILTSQLKNYEIDYGFNNLTYIYISFFGQLKKVNTKNISFLKEEGKFLVGDLQYNIKDYGKHWAFTEEELYSGETE